MTYKLFEGKNIIFGAIWGVLAFFIGGFLVKAIEFIDKLLGMILKAVLWVFLAPLKIIEFTGITGTGLKLSLVIVVALLVSPIARVIFEKIKEVFKKSPI